MGGQRPGSLSLEKRRLTGDPMTFSSRKKSSCTDGDQLFLSWRQDRHGD